MMRFELQAAFTLSSDVSGLTREFDRFIAQTNESILKVDELRKAGVGQLLLQMGRISEDELEKLMTRIEDSKQK